MLLWRRHGSLIVQQFGGRCPVKEVALDLWISPSSRGSSSEEDDAIFVLGDIILWPLTKLIWCHPRRREHHPRQGMIMGVNMYLSAWLRRNPTATALLSHDYTSRRLTLRLSHYPTRGTPPPSQLSLHHDLQRCWMPTSSMIIVRISRIYTGGIPLFLLKSKTKQLYSVPGTNSFVELLE